MKENMRKALLECVRKEMKNPACGLSNEQWCGLLNSYVRREPPELCAAKNGLKPLQADRWYIRLSLGVVRQAVKNTYSS